MEKTENNKFKFISVTLIIAIVALIIIVIIPKFTPATPEKIIEKIDFSNSAWIEQYVEKSVGLFGKDFFLGTAFSYNIRSNKMIVTYATQKSIEEAREYFLALPGAEKTGRNDETSLNITTKITDQTLRVYNYYSPISRVIEMEFTLDPDRAEVIISQLENTFPTEELANISEINELVSGDLFGGYVRYRYDNLDEFAYPFTPIYSRAYLYHGTEDDFYRTIDLINEAYPNYKFDESQNTYYYQISQQIVSVSFFVTDLNENVVSISIQKEMNEGS